MGHSSPSSRLLLSYVENNPNSFPHRQGSWWPTPTLGLSPRPPQHRPCWSLFSRSLFSPQGLCPCCFLSWSLLLTPAWLSRVASCLRIRVPCEKASPATIYNGTSPAPPSPSFLAVECELHTHPFTICAPPNQTTVFSPPSKDHAGRGSAPAASWCGGQQWTVVLEERQAPRRCGGRGALDPGPRDSRGVAAPTAPAPRCIRYTVSALPSLI